MYADDTPLYCNLKDFVDCDTETAINRELHQIKLSPQRNKLTVIHGFFISVRKYQI